jgi:hypothetical protein
MAQAHVFCDEVNPGLRPSEVIAVIKDHAGRRHFLRAERDYLKASNGSSYFPVAVVHAAAGGLVLVELPHEAETGANRLWVSKDRLLEPVEVPT